MPPGLPDPPSHVDADRRAILRAASVVAQHRGYHGTTLERVAEVAQVSQEAVLAHYSDRVGILRDALQLAFQDWYDEVPTWKDVEPLPDLRAEIERRLVAGVTAGARAADFWRLGLLLSLEPALAGTGITEVFLDVRQRTRDALRDYWSRILSDTPVGDPAVVEVVARGHLALADGAMLATHGSPEWDLERMMSLVAGGIAAALEQGSPLLERVERVDR